MTGLEGPRNLSNNRGVTRDCSRETIPVDLYDEEGGGDWERRDTTIKRGGGGSYCGTGVETLRKPCSNEQCRSWWERAKLSGMANLIE